MTRIPKNHTIADLHFFHKHILDYEPRPWETLEDMVEGLIANWNRVVYPEDNVFIVGDFWPGKDEPTKAIVDRLNGRKHMILGNHDLSLSMNKWYSLGFFSVCYQMVMPLNKNITIKFCHYPYTGANHKEKRPIKEENMWLIHGHTHSKGSLIDYENKTICVSCELTNYTPIDFDRLIALILKGEKCH